MSRFFFDSETATPITATMRNLWIGVKSSQATASARLKPTVLAELASSALTSRPWSDTHASRLAETIGRLGWAKLLESRRAEGVEENGARETRAAPPVSKPSSISASCSSSFIAGFKCECERERDFGSVIEAIIYIVLLNFERSFWVFG